MISAYDSEQSLRPVEDVLRDCIQACIDQGGQCRNGERRAYGLPPEPDTSDIPNKHCVVGWLLPPDDERLMGFESDVYELVALFPNLGPNQDFIVDNVEILSTLQMLHDASPENAPSRKSALLKKYPSLEPVINDWVALRMRQRS